MISNDVREKIAKLFDEKLISLTYINPGYDNTNNVFSVTTKNGKFIVKILKETAVSGSIFWRGLDLLFGATFEESIKNQKKLSEYLSQFGIIAVPKILEAEYSYDNPVNSPYVIMEMMTGDPVQQDSDLEREVMQNKEVAYQLGAFLSKIHAEKFNFFGNLSKKGFLLTEFPNQLFSAIKTLANTRKAMQNKEVQKMLSFFLKQAETMDPPTSSGLIMLDLWPSQFLISEAGISALIDIEGYVIGPIELELVLVELWLKNHSKFKEAYIASGAKWPDFEHTRELYRFFFYLLYDCPEAGLQACLDSRLKFPQGDRIKSRMTAPRPRPGGYTNPFNPSE